MKEHDQKTVINFLKKHKLTSEWFLRCERQHMMDAPMMIVDVIMCLPQEEKDELISNIDKIELFGKYTQGAKDEWAKEVIKYLIGLPSKYQPPTKWRFYGDGDNNQEIINTVIN